ncbi:hypothetical protein Tco_1354097 [Tanacetum coccineum]
MVAFLNKLEGSEDFHQIIDFLTISHIKYALTENPTIYTSLIQQFWETASASTSENEEMEITATIDGRVKTITQASIRRHIKLEVAMGHFSPQWRFLIHTILHCLSPKTIAWEQFSSNIATAIICLVTNRTFNFSKMIFDGMLKNLDSRRWRICKNDLKQTKLTYGAAYTKLILRVKKLEHKVKASKSRRMARVILSDNEEDLEDSYKHGRIIAEIDQNPSISLVQDKGTSWIQEDAKIQTRTSADNEILLKEPTKLVEDFGSGKKGEKEISTANISVSTASAILEVVLLVLKKTKKQLEEERLSHEAAIRLQEQVNEEERQRIARDAEIAKQLQEEIDTARQEQEKSDLEKALEFQKQLDEREEVVAKANPAQNHGGYKQIHFKGMSYEDIRPIFERIWDQNQSFVPKDSEIEKDVMKRSGFDFQKPPRFDRDDLEKLWDLVNKMFSLTEPIVDKEKVLWVELKRLFEPDDDDTLWKLQRYIYDPLKWRLYDTCGVHHVSTERGHDIFMLVEKDYLLTRALMTVMLANKLQVDESSKMANEILRKSSIR